MCAAAALPAGASAVGRQARAGHAGQDAAKPYHDSRVGARRAATRAGSIGSARERSARTRLRRSLGAQAVVQVDALTGTARSVQRLDGTLTGPASGDRAAIAMRWVESNRAALGLGAADLDTLRLSDRSVDEGSGFTYLRYRQFFQGIPTFDGGLRVNLDRGGRILNVTGAPVPDLSVPSVDPALSGTAALRALQANVGVRRAIAVRSGPTGARQVTRFARGDFARLVLFDGPDGVRLAWHVLYRATSLALYDAVVDATTGKILFRQNLTKFDDAEQDVFPNYPGAERDPNGDKALANVKRTVSFEPDWLGDTTLNLEGPNAHVYTDRDDSNDPTNDNADPEEITRLDGDADFNDTFTPFQDATSNACDLTDPTDPDPDWPAPLGETADCAWDPADPATRDDNREQAGVQAFYFVNEFHDHLESTPIGFDENGGNFEGDDPVEVNAGDGMDTNDGGEIPDANHVNNANMSTPPDGQSPLMQMYLFRYDPARFFRFRNIDGDDDAGTVWHEYTHGLSNRLITHDDGSGATASPHTGAMGEAWSDWYALDLLHRRGLEIDTATIGDVDIGIYTDATFTATRFEPVDCTPADEDAPRCPGGADTGAGGYTFGDFGLVAGAPEVHSDGEIWTQTLWDLRRALIAEHGDDPGADKAEQLVTQGMRLSPPEPSFLDMRNAILAAEAGLPNSNADRDLIWQVFADRGMGFFAGVADSSDTSPEEDFNLPPDPAAPKGNVAGTVTSADTGLPLAAVSVGFGGLTTDPSFPDYVAPATTGANGAYTLQAPAGTYGGLVFDRPGWDRVTARSLQVPANGTRSLNAALRRDWASARGGADVIATSDDTGLGFGCGVDQLIDQNQGVGWSAFNPDSDDPENPGAGPPTAVIELPARIDISAFGMDPGSTCGDDLTATTKDYRVETSADGVNFTIAKAGAFTLADARRLNLVAPTANATGVKFIRLTLLSPQRAQAGDSGADFIDFSEFEVFGGPRNVLPSGSLTASATRVNPGETVRFTAAFTDPDSKITGYRWDFDGNGTIEQTTAAPTASFVYPRSGDFTARVSATDFRGGAGSATEAIRVTSAPIAARPPKRGTHGRLRLRVSCELSCTATAKLTLSKKLAKKLGLKRKRIVGSLERALPAGSSKRLTIKLTKKAKRALKRHHRKSVKVTATVTVRYADGRHDRAKRKVTIRR
ncbi:MAG TPA: M36 family metallopeptidase [Solirubrobacteraceae bacterium]|nr:M36 family metallopeptidase [Solirubrobacteraceae bacterium]